MEKPPVLSEEQLQELKIPCNKCARKPIFFDAGCLKCVVKYHREAQRDADVEWYEKWYLELLEDYKRVKEQRAALINKFEQARQETARELMQTIEVMYPELKQVYWNGKDWQSLKAKYVK